MPILKGRYVMGISTLMSAAHAAGYAMGVPEELGEECVPVVSNAPDGAERPDRMPDARKTDASWDYWASIANMREWFASWSGRAAA